MSYSETTALGQVVRFGRAVSLVAIVLLALVLCGVTLLSALGVLPWFRIEAGFGELTSPYAGMALQIAVTALLVGLCFFLPADFRMRRLETSHRDFHISMEDVTAAYQTAHARDRDGVFNLSSEFDGVRERLNFLRSHPDLRGLEPDVLEVAAQMSEKSRELADIYAKEKVERAQTFLQQRQEEAAAFDERLKVVTRTLGELKRWDQQLNVEESLRKTQLEQLEQDLFDLLPTLGYEVDVEKIDPRILEQEVVTRKPNVVALDPGHAPRKG